MGQTIARLCEYRERGRSCLFNKNNICRLSAKTRLPARFLSKSSPWTLFNIIVNCPRTTKAFSKHASRLSESTDSQELCIKLVQPERCSFLVKNKYCAFAVLDLAKADLADITVCDNILQLSGYCPLAETQLYLYCEYKFQSLIL